MTTDEKLDRLTLLMEHLAEDVQDIKSDLKEFRTENVKEHEVLYNQIASVAQALHHTIVDNDTQHEVLRAKDAELEQIQRINSADITALRAVI